MLLYNALNIFLKRFKDVIIIKAYDKRNKIFDIVLNLSNLCRSSRLKINKY